jgi:hypothetical protein
VTRADNNPRIEGTGWWKNIEKIQDKLFFGMKYLHEVRVFPFHLLIGGFDLNPIVS